MKTSGFFDYRQGPGRVSIARFAPRGYPAGFRVFRALAPGQWFNKVSELEYRRLYLMEILRPLDPRRVWDDLHALVSPHEPVLLCYERQKDLETGTTYCHRRMVASWFRDELGCDVDELVAKHPQVISPSWYLQPRRAHLREI
jgi:hypothetical protein